MYILKKYKIPVVIEDKFGVNKLISQNKNGIKLDDKSIANYAVNGAIFYAQNMVASDKYNEVIQLEFGDSEENVKINVYYVYGSMAEPKYMEMYKSLDFLENEETFENFYNDAILSEQDKHNILISTQEQLKKNMQIILIFLMNNHNIPVDQRVVYISGMLLSMRGYSR